jgi:hypothetical protein
MSSKYTDSKSDFKSTYDSKSGRDDEEEIFASDGKYDDTDNGDEFKNLPQVNITEIKIKPSGVVDVTAPLTLDMKFELSRDVVAASWVIKFLVDSSHSRIIKVLGQTEVEDYPDGESDMHFHVDYVDIDNIPPSSLTNSGLLMAVLMVDGEEVVGVNMVSLDPFFKLTILVTIILSLLFLVCSRLFKFTRKMA